MTNEKKETFWIVWNPDSSKPPRYSHISRAIADIEAARLAHKNPNQIFYVMEWVGGSVLKQLNPQEKEG